MGLEQKYEDIQVKVTENNEEMARKLNEIQVTSIRVENQHKASEYTVNEASKTYADIINAPTINTKENAIAEMRVIGIRKEKRLWNIICGMLVCRSVFSRGSLARI